MKMSVVVWIILLGLVISGCSGGGKTATQPLADKEPAVAKTVAPDRFIMAGSGTNLPITETVT